MTGTFIIKVKESERKKKKKIRTWLKMQARIRQLFRFKVQP